MNKSVLILTGTSDEYGYHQNGVKMEEVFDLTLPSKIRYAQKYGYDFLAIRSFKKIRNLYGFNKDGHLGFLRAVKAFEMCSMYDIVMWIDADSIITKDMPITDFPIEGKTFCASYDWLPDISSFSCGNFIIQNTEEINSLFKLFIQIGVTHNPVDQEQGTLNHIHRATELGRNTMKILDYKFLGAVPKVLEENQSWHGRPEIATKWDENCFLAHLTGSTNQERVDVLTKYFQKYL